MILYNSLLAKIVLSKEQENFMLFGINFTQRKYVEPFEEMEMLIHQKQYNECTALGLLPALILSLLISWWFILLIPSTYYILYSIEWIILRCSKGSRRQSAFYIEARKHRHDLLYLRKRKHFAWTKYFGTH